MRPRPSKSSKMNIRECRLDMSPTSYFIVYRERDGLDAAIVANEGLNARVMSDGEVGSGPVFL